MVFCITDIDTKETVQCTFRDLSMSCASDGSVEGILSPTQLLCFTTDGVKTVVCRYVRFMEIMKILIKPIHRREIRKDNFKQQKGNAHLHIEGILSKGPYLPCVSMAGRALLAGYHRYLDCMWVVFVAGNLLFIKTRYTNPMSKFYKRAYYFQIWYSIIKTSNSK